MKKLFLKGIKFLGIMLLGIILFIGAFFFYLNNYQGTSDTKANLLTSQYILDEQKRLNIDCNGLRNKLMPFLEFEVGPLISEESSKSIYPSVNPKVQEEIANYRNAIFECSRLYGIDKKYQINELPTLEYTDRIYKDFLIVATDIMYPDSLDACDENCRKMKSKRLKNAYQKVMTEMNK